MLTYVLTQAYAPWCPISLLGVWRVHPTDAVSADGDHIKFSTSKPKWGYTDHALCLEQGGSTDPALRLEQGGREVILTMLCAWSRGALQQMLCLVDKGQKQFSTSQQEEILHHPQLTCQVGLLNHHHPQVLQTHVLIFWTHLCTDILNKHTYWSSEHTYILIFWTNTHTDLQNTHWSDENTQILIFWINAYPLNIHILIWTNRHTHIMTNLLTLIFWTQIWTHTHKSNQMYKLIFCIT